MVVEDVVGRQSGPTLVLAERTRLSTGRDSLCATPAATPAADLSEAVAGDTLVPDAPFASALNRHLNHPHHGPFAITPRRLGARCRDDDNCADVVGYKPDST